METSKAIAKRKSTRAFSPEKQISEANMEAILAAGCAAPVGMGDYDSLHLTVIQSPEALASINNTVKQTLKIDRDVLYGAPTLVLVCASDTQKAPNIQYSNVACVVENMLLAATDLGIDCVYLWTAANVISADAGLCKEFGIPVGYKPVSGAVFGYAVENDPTEKELNVTISINRV